MRTLHFTLRLTPEDLHRWYRGEVRHVRVWTEERLVLQLPAIHLQRFITPTGIQGRFRIRFDASNRFVDIVQL